MALRDTAIVQAALLTNHKYHSWQPSTTHLVSSSRILNEPLSMLHCSGALPDIVPEYVGENFYCDVDNTNTFTDADRLWDKYDCIVGAETCCEYGQWFCTDHLQATTDDVEFRVCADEPSSNEDVYIEYVDIFVQ